MYMYMYMYIYMYMYMYMYYVHVHVHVHVYTHTHRSMRPSTSLDSSARDIFMFKCLGPDWSAVRKGRLISVLGADESSHLAFSAASRSR